MVGGLQVGRRTLTVVDVAEIFVRWHAGQSQGEIATGLRLDRKTVRKYLQPAQIKRLHPGRVSLSREDWTALARIWFPEVADARLRRITWIEIAPHQAYIEAMLRRASVAQIWRQLRDERGLTSSLASFRRHVRTMLADQANAVESVFEDRPSGRDGEFSDAGEELLDPPAQLPESDATP